MQPLDVSRRPRSDLIWINTRAFAIRLHLHARVSVERWTSDAAIFLYIHGQDLVEDDPDGTYLPDVAAALSYAEYTIRELRRKSGCNDLAPMMIVKDQAQQMVLALPFFPGC